MSASKHRYMHIKQLESDGLYSILEFEKDYSMPIRMGFINDLTLEQAAKICDFLNKMIGWEEDRLEIGQIYFTAPKGKNFDHD